MSDVAGTAVEAAKTLPPSTVDALKSALVDIINGTVKSAGDAKDFVLAQVPDVVQQLVIFHTIWYAVAAVFLLLAGVVSGILFLKYVKPVFRCISEPMDEAFATIVVVGWFVGTLGVLIACAVNTYNFLMVYFAPKVWLIHYAVGLVQEIKK
jgi:hypothetical protein